jgi:hypothetical protein
MGGLGSGRTGGRTRIDSVRRIDIRRLHREGVLSQPHASVSWYLGGRRAGSVDIFPSIDEVRLSYNVRCAGESNFCKTEEVVSITRTSCNYGGHRPWFLCPGCKCRVAILYLGRVRFLCRHCYDLIHDSVNEGRYDKMLRRSRMLRRKLGADVLAFGASVSRPKGMHLRTFGRLQDELACVERGMTVWLVDFLGLSL